MIVVPLCDAIKTKKSGNSLRKTKKLLQMNQNGSVEDDERGENSENFLKSALSISSDLLLHSGQIRREKTGNKLSDWNDIMSRKTIAPTWFESPGKRHTQHALYDITPPRQTSCPVKKNTIHITPIQVHPLSVYERERQKKAIGNQESKKHDDITDKNRFNSVYITPGSQSIMFNHTAHNTPQTPKSRKDTIITASDYDFVFTPKNILEA